MGTSLGTPVTRALAIVALLAAPLPARAQDLLTVPLDSGTLVRLDVRDSGLVRGRLLQAYAPSGSQFVYCLYPASHCADVATNVRTTARGDVRRIEVADGTRLGRGVMFGGIIGAGLALAYVTFANGICDDSRCKQRASRAALFPLALGIGLGAAFGSSDIKWRWVR